jgi:laminin gamma 1
LDGVKDEELDKLETELTNAANILNDSVLEKEVTTMKEKQLEQQKRITQFQWDIDKLKQEVENVEKIRNSLPHQCFNIIDLEQEGTRR